MVDMESEERKRSAEAAKCYPEKTNQAGPERGRSLQVGLATFLLGLLPGK
jgi:hypothetical protein